MEQTGGMGAFTVKEGTFNPSDTIYASVDFLGHFNPSRTVYTVLLCG